MKCHYCAEGAMEEFHGFEYRGRKLNNISGLKCNICGEVTFDSKVYETFEEIDRKLDGLLAPEEIKKTRKSIKLTQEKIALELNIPRLTVLRWENGQAIQTPQNDANLRELFIRHKKSQNEQKQVVMYLEGITSAETQTTSYGLAAHHQGEFKQETAERIHKILKSKKNEKR